LTEKLKYYTKKYLHIQSVSSSLTGKMYRIWYW